MNKTMRKGMLLTAMVAMLLTNMTGCSACNVSVDVPGITLAPTATAVPTQDAEPTKEVAPVATPTDAPESVDAPEITEEVVPTEIPSITEEVVPTTEPVPTEGPVPTVTPTAVPEPTATVVPTEAPTATPEPTNTPVPTVTPTQEPTPTPKPTATPKPTSTPKPTATPTPVPVKGIVAGDYVTFGMYPQNEITGSALTDEIVNAEYTFVEESECHVSLWQAIVNGTEYYKVEDGTTSNGKTEYHYFTPEPVEWLVLETKDGKAFVISKYLLEKQCFDSRYNSNDKYEAMVAGKSYNFYGCWADSTLRPWLNGEFMDSVFSKEEQKCILLSEVKNEPYSFNNTSSGPDTKDKMYLLSEEEALQYFGDYCDGESETFEPFSFTNVCPDQTIQCGEMTEFFRFKYDVDLQWDEYNSWAKKNYAYSLRTTGVWDTHTLIVDYCGIIDDDLYGMNKAIGVRPCMWIDLESDAVEKVK